MNARDEILARLREQARDVAPPPPWRSRRQFEDLAEQFTEALTAVKGEVWRAASLEEAFDQVDRVLHEIAAETAVANQGPPFDAIDLAGRWPEVKWRVAGQSEGELGRGLRDFAVSADIGLSGVDAALAETGTVVVSSGPGRSRLTTLLPPVHLALAPTSSLTSDIFTLVRTSTWLAARGPVLSEGLEQRSRAGREREKVGEMPAATTLISGPSKTADIEQTMAIGVHGPKRFIVVLYDD
jgi:L-lactate dehydrogenase complex protein LldG